MQLVTHVRPHLDDICAVWLIRRFWTGADAAPVSYINNNLVPPDVDASPEKIYVGVGRGRFDEHRGVPGACAASLVWDDLRERAAADDLTKRGVDRLVAWVLKEDTGQFKGQPGREFSVPLILVGHFRLTGKDSAATLAFGLTLLDDLLEVQRDTIRLEDDWQKRVEFPSRFGRAVAVVTDAQNVDEYAYAHGYDLVLITAPDRSYWTARARVEAPIDLTPVAQKLHGVDPGADWFFHHSKRLLILGGDHHPQAKPTRLTREEFIDLFR